MQDKDVCRYKTYGGYFTSTAIASVQLKLIEFNSYKDQIINYKVQVDDLQRRKDSKYDIIIGSDLMNELNIDLKYSTNTIAIGKGKDKDSIPMKPPGALSDASICELIYDMHMEAPILQQQEERQKRLLDANYSKK